MESKDTILYIIGTDWGTGSGKIFALDISRPSRPLEIGSHVPSHIGFYDIAIDEDLLAATRRGVDAQGYWVGFVRILDISDPRSLNQISELMIPRVKIEGLTFSEGYIYASYFDGRNSGILTVDARDPASLSLTDTCIVSSNPWDLIKVGQYGYTRGDDMSVLDMSDPSAPVEIGYISYDSLDDSLGFGYDIAYSDGFIYLAEFEGLRVVDVREPAAPEEVCYLDDEISKVFGVVTMGDYLYIVADYAIIKLDITDRSHPQKIYTSQRFGGWGLEIAGDHAYSTLITSDLGCDGGVQSIDLDHLFEISKYYYFPRKAQRVRISGDYAYVGDPYFGLRLINIADPAAPWDSGYYRIRAQGVDVFHSYAFIGEWNLGPLRIIDVSDPKWPDLAWSFNLPVGGPGSVFATLFSGDHAIAIGRDIDVIDISDLPYVEGVSHLQGAGGCSAALYDTLILVGSKNGHSPEFRVWDISDQWELTVIGELDLENTVEAIAVRGDIAFLAVGTAGVLAVSLADPSRPEIAGSYDTPHYVKDIAIEGEYAAIADSAGGLRLLKVSDPEQMVEVGYYLDTLGVLRYMAYAQGVALRDRIAYVANSFYFDIYDCSEALSAPDLPVLLLPLSLSLACYPNPFNSTANIRFTLPRAGPVRLELLDPLGRLVRELMPGNWMADGQYQLPLKGADLPSGCYYLNLHQKGAVEVQPIIVNR
jgi:hypothetical protein